MKEMTLPPIFSIDKEIEGEVFVVEGVGPTESVLGIHVAEVFVGLSIEFEWSSGLRVDNDFSGYSSLIKSTA